MAQRASRHWRSSGPGSTMPSSQSPAIPQRPQWNRRRLSDASPALRLRDRAPRLHCDRLVENLHLLPARAALSGGVGPRVPPQTEHPAETADAPLEVFYFNQKTAYEMTEALGDGAIVKLV